MLNAHSEIMTNCGLRLEKVANLEKVLSIKLLLNQSISIFAIAHLQSLDDASNLMTYPAQYGGCPASSV